MAQGFAPEVGGAVTEGLGQGLGNAAESAAPALSPTAALAGDLAAQPPDVAIADLANVDISEPTLADAPGGEKLAELRDKLKAEEGSVDLGSDGKPGLSPEPPPEIGAADRAIKSQHDAEGKQISGDTPAVESGDKSGQPPSEPPTAEGASADEPEDQRSMDLSSVYDQSQPNAEVDKESKQPPIVEQQPKIPEDIQKRIDEINEEMKNGNFEHEDELESLKAKAQEVDELQKLQSKEWKDLNKYERARRRELEAKASGEGGQELTAEQQAEVRDKEIENLGTEMMQKMAKGEEITEEEEKRLQELIAEKKMAEAGFTPEQAREAAKKALEYDKGKSEKGRRKTQEAKEKIQELMSLELQIISQRNLVKQLNERRKVAIEEAKQAHNEAERAKPDERLKKKGIEYSKYMVVANYSAQIEGIRFMAQRIDARRKNLEQQVRRELGVTGGLRALAEWGGAKINNVMTEIVILAEEELPFGMGEPFGAYQRGQLSSSGRI